MFRFALTFLCVSACLEFPTPDEREIEVIDELALPHQQEAMFVLEDYAREFASENGFSFANIGSTEPYLSAKVYWSDRRCPTDQTQAAVVYRDTCYHGLTFNCWEIYVAATADGTVCHSALLHEFGHCLISRINGNGGDGDQAHRAAWLWELVDRADAYACMRGW